MNGIIAYTQTLKCTVCLNTFVKNIVHAECITLQPYIISCTVNVPFSAQVSAMVLCIVHTAVDGDSEVFQEWVFSKLVLDLAPKLHHVLLRPTIVLEQLVSQELGTRRPIRRIQSQAPLQSRNKGGQLHELCILCYRPGQVPTSKC